jgi:hypothetical protein
MNLQEQFETLHPDIIRDFLATGESQAISLELQHYIQVLDKIPEVQRQYPSVTKCARELVRIYPQFNLTFHTARQIIYDAINYFHLNSTVKNEAWNNYYADRAEELHNICVKMGDMKTAGAYLQMAHEWRHNPNENLIDSDKIKPSIQVLSPEVTWEMLTGKKETPSLKTIAGERLNMFKKAEKEIDSYPINKEQKEQLKNEAARSLNINDAEIEPDE